MKDEVFFMEAFETIGNIAGIVILVCMLLTVIGCGVIALFRGLKKSLGSAAVIVVSAIFSAIITALLCKPSSGWVNSVVDIISGMSGMEEIFSIEAVATLVKYYSVMIVKPFVFAVIFFLLRFVLGIVMRIVIKHIPILNDLDKKVSMLGGAGVGVVMGFVISIMMFMPLLGTVNVVNTAVAELDGAAESEELSSIHSLTGALTERGAGKIMLSAGGKGIYNSLASCKYEGERVTLTDEVKNVVGLVSSFTALSSDIAEYGDEQVNAVQSIADALDRSVLLRGTVAGVLSEASTKWVAGEQFMGMDKIDAGEVVEPIIDELLVIMQTSDKDNISGDVRTLAAVFETLVEGEVLAAANEPESMLERLSAEGVVSGVVSATGSNERMVPMVDAITETGVRALASAIGIPMDSAELYDSFISELADTVSASMALDEDERLEAVTDNVKHLLAEYGVELSDDEVKAIGEGIVSEFGGKYAVGSDELKQHLSNSSGIGDSDTIQSSIVTVDDITANLGKFSNSDDPEEAANIEKTFVELVGIVEKVNGETDDKTAIIESIGPALEAMKDTSVFGDDATEKILAATLQTESISQATGIPRGEAANIAQTLKDAASSGSGYSEIVSSVSNTINVVQSVTDPNISKQEQVEKIETLIINMTPASASAMKEIANETLLESMGVPEERSAVSANAASNLFDNMASFKEEYPEASDEDFKKEADAVNHVFVLAVGKEEDDESEARLFDNEETGEQGEFEMTAYESVELIVNSVVISDTLEDLVYGEGDNAKHDPLEAADSISDSDKQLLSDALDEYYDDNKSENGIERKLVAIGALFGVEKSFN